MNNNSKDSKPIKVVFDPDGYVEAAGDPKCFKAKDMKQYDKPGYVIKTMTFKEYQDANYKWIWDKTDKL